MITAYQAALNGMPLHQLAESICIVDIAEQPPEERIHTEEIAGMDGQRLMRRQRLSLTVAVSVAIRESHRSRRSDVLDRVLQWMRQGGWLTVSTRPGKRLWVEGVPSLMGVSADRWTETLTLSFTAREQPFWQDAVPVTAVIANAGERQLYVPGTAADALCDAAVRNTGGEICRQLTITAGSTHLTFEELQLQPGETLYCRHDGRALLSMTIDGAAGSRSAYALRTSDSSDDLRLACGSIGTVSVQGQQIETTLEVRGRWL